MTMFQTGAPSSSSASASVDPYALFEALTGKKINKDTLSEVSTTTEDYDDLGEFGDKNNGERNNMGQEPQPDRAPKDGEVMVGCINPYALVEASKYILRTFPLLEIL